MSKHDHNIATRFNIFRKTFVAKSMVDAAKKLACSHSKISDIETGKRAIDYLTILILVKDFGLNADWLYTGRGEPRIESVVQYNAPRDLNDFDSSAPLTNEDMDKVAEFSHQFDDVPDSSDDMEHLIKMNRLMQEVLQTMVTGVKHLTEKVTELSDRVASLESKK